MSDSPISQGDEAVHVAREGNDVVKRASELTKENGATSNEGPSDEGPEARKGKDQEMKEAPQSEEGAKATLSRSKRERVETPQVEMPVNKKVEEEASAEKDTGKEVKKAKVEGVKKAKAEGAKRAKVEGAKKAKVEGVKAGRNKQDKSKLVSDEKAADKAAEKTNKKKTAAKAKKGGEESPVIYADTPATRTRSKAP